MARLSVTRRGLDADSPLSISITGGSVQTVTAADATVTVAGSTANPTVKVGPTVVRATTTAGAPTTGTWQTDQAIVDSNAAVWICTAGGTPGTWVEGSGGGGGSVTITSPDASITVAGTSSAPTVEVAAALQADATGALQRSGGTMSGPIAMGASKVTGLANGTVSTDAAAFGQIPAALPPNGAAGGSLSGTYPNPAVASIPSAATGTTQAALDNTTKLSTTAYADAAVGVEKTRALAAEGLLAPKASPTFTGTPIVPTAAADTNTTQAASAAFVLGQTSATAPVMDGTAAAGSSTRYARSDHVHPSDTSRAPVTENVNTVATSGSAQTIPANTSDTINRITLSAACTLTFPTAGAGKSFTLQVVQPATGGPFAVTWPGSALVWVAGSAPTQATAASKRDLYSFTCIDGTNWEGVQVSSSGGY